MPAHGCGMLKRRERRHRANRQAIRPSRDGRVFAFYFSKAHEFRWTEHAGLHHQHEGGPASDGSDRVVVGIKQFDRFSERGRFGELKGYHRADLFLWRRTARRRLVIWLSISFGTQARLPNAVTSSRIF